MADDGLRGRLARSGEDALGKLAQDLLENPLVNTALTRAFEAREKATQAQEAAMGALNIPSAADVERLTRRLRSVSQRLEGIEDGVDRLDQRLAELRGGSAGPLTAIEGRLGSIEGQLAKLAGDLTVLAHAFDAAPSPVPREQERLAVAEDAPAAKAPAAAAAKAPARTASKPAAKAPAKTAAKAPAKTARKTTAKAASKPRKPRTKKSAPAS